MKPSELKIALVAAIRARLPILITGAPGIGKSDVVEQATIAANADLILSHPAVADPTDAKGLPWVVNGAATFLAFGELQRAIDATVPTVWFLDDLGQASAAVQASYMQLLLARQVNEHKISDHITFIAATNRRTDRAGVSGILEPVKSRFGSIIELTPDLNEWCNWAIDRDLPPELIAFLRFQPDLLCKFTATADLTNCPVPRTWSHVARILALGVPPAIQYAMIEGAIGAGAATELTAFLRLYAELPSIDQILIDPNSVSIPTNPSTLYAVSAALAHRATQQNFSRVAQFVQRLVDAGSSEFGVLTIRDAMQRTPAIAQTSAFVRLVTGDLGVMINGQ